MDCTAHAHIRARPKPVEHVSPATLVTNTAGANYCSSGNIVNKEESSADIPDLLDTRKSTATRASKGGDEDVRDSGETPHNANGSRSSTSPRDPVNKFRVSVIT